MGVTETPLEPTQPVDPVEPSQVVGSVYGTTVQDVLNLIHTVSVDMGDGYTQHGGRVREGTIYITSTQVEAWIRQVSSRVTTRLKRFYLVSPDVPFYLTVLSSARDVVANGAASYAYAAAAPEKASTADTTSYAEVLWRRYLDGLEVLEEMVDDWVKDNVPGVDDDDKRLGGLPGRGRFPKPRVRDCDRW